MIPIITTPLANNNNSFSPKYLSSVLLLAWTSVEISQGVTRTYFYLSIDRKVIFNLVQWKTSNRSSYLRRLIQLFSFRIRRSYQQLLKAYKNAKLMSSIQQKIYILGQALPNNILIRMFGKNSQCNVLSLHKWLLGFLIKRRIEREMMGCGSVVMEKELNYQLKLLLLYLFFEVAFGQVTRVE